MFNGPMNNATPHIIRSNHNNLDMVGIISTTEDGTQFFHVGSATGPMDPGFRSGGAIGAGTMLRLGYDYDTDEYANQRPGGWICRVIRINRRTITVQSRHTGRLHKIEWN